MEVFNYYHNSHDRLYPHIFTGHVHKCQYVYDYEDHDSTVEGLAKASQASYSSPRVHTVRKI